MPELNTFIDPFYDSEEWRQLHRAVLRRDGRRCQYCGADGTQVDHIIPRKKGGPDTLDNLVCCCNWCNHVVLNKRFPSREAKREWLQEQRQIQEADRLAGRPDRFERRFEAFRLSRERGVPVWKIHRDRSKERKLGRNKTI